MTQSVKVWVVDDDQSLRWVLEQALTDAGMEVRCFPEAESVARALIVVQPDVLITDVHMPGTDGIELLGNVAREFPNLPVIIMTAHSDLDSAVNAYKGGAFEYLPKPFDVDEAVALVLRAAAEAESTSTPISEPPAPSLPSLIGQAPAMQEVYRAIGRLANSSFTVLVTGESGTGKELIARALHDNSPRSSKPFIALNMSAIPADLLESELFGHERGAFTGADTRRIGRFEQADGGTLFLDEIGDMSLDLQTRLLRVLSEGAFYRVGGQQAIAVDVRVVAATNRTLEDSVAAGQFREDLYHRLNVIAIESPPLRERRQDIPALVQHYLNNAAAELGVETKQIQATALKRLVAFDWPGNVRQLVNFCRRLTVTAPGSSIGPDELPKEVIGERSFIESPEWQVAFRHWAEQALKAPPKGGVSSIAVPEFERILINAALAQAEGHRQNAARLLGWGRNTLTRKIQALGLGTRSDLD